MVKYRLLALPVIGDRGDFWDVRWTTPYDDKEAEDDVAHYRAPAGRRTATGGGS